MAETRRYQFDLNDIRDGEIPVEQQAQIQATLAIAERLEALVEILEPVFESWATPPIYAEGFKSPIQTGKCNFIPKEVK